MRLRLLDTATESGSLEGLKIPGSGIVAGTELWATGHRLDDAILFNLAMLGLGSGSRLSFGSLGEELSVTVIWSLRKLPGVVYEERNSNGAL